MNRVRRPGLAALLALAALGSGAAGAQQVFRITGPDGRVTFSDQPPVSGQAKPAPSVSMPAEGGTGAALPFDLRNAASRYPVTLYTGPECGPCGTAKAFLASRGIPYIERTVNTDEDAEALKRISGANRLPVVTIGGQRVTGFVELEWAQYLDAAGYPKTSQLPSSYRAPPPAPLVAAQRPAAPAAAAAAPAAPAAAPRLDTPPAIHARAP
jgi:glutaredoxin